MTLVYRVETQDGEGPYTGWPRAWTDPSDLGIDKEVLHPEPELDGLEETQFDELFAFASVEQFMDWFGFEAVILSLEEQGFVLATYDIPPERVQRGGRQVKYVPTENPPVERRSLSEVYYSNIRFSVDIIEHDE
jgi:hypothetical protein